MGNDAICGCYLNPMLVKSQYRWEMFYPVAETQSYHVTGQTTFIWGPGRQIPQIGEDAVYVLWRWTDCCMLTK